MKKIFLSILVFLMCIDPTSAQQLTSTEVASSIEKSVVKISTYNKYNQILGRGSGVVIGVRRILTNYHVFSDAGEYMIIENNNKKYRSGNIVSYSKKEDYLVVNVPDLDLKSITLGNSDSVKKGDVVYAMGTTLGIHENRFTSGMVSGMWKSTSPRIIFSAQTYYGNSGGALVNIKGELIGIVNAMDSIFNAINYAIPINHLIGLINEHDERFPRTKDYDKDYIGKYYIPDSNRNNIPRNDYGSGNGFLTIYLSNGNPLDTVLVSLDGKLVGELSKIFVRPVTCGERGTISLVTTTGVHNVDYYWKSNTKKKVFSTTVPVNEGGCSILGFTVLETKERVVIKPHTQSRISVYSLKPEYSNSIIKIDGYVVGQLNNWFKIAPSCGQLGTFVKNVAVGSHRIEFIKPGDINPYYSIDRYVGLNTCFEIPVHQ